MKTKLFAFVAILISSLLVTVNAQTWEYVKTLQNEWLQKICTQGLDTVYVVGQNGLIAQSTNRALTWNKQYSSSHVTLNDAVFINHYTGFAVGNNGTILRTTDAGVNWTVQSSGTTNNLNAIAATELDNIWAVGNNSLILHSSNGGITWEQLNILPTNDRQLLDIAFRNSLGYFTGNQGTVYKTENYGTNWNKQAFIESANCYAINIMENKTYIVCGTNLLSTQDQIHWQTNELSNSFSGTFGLSFLNDNDGFCSSTYYGLVLGNSNAENDGYLPLILTTTAGGNNREWSWTNMGRNIQQGQYPSNPLYLDIQMINDTLGYAIFGKSLLKLSNTSIYSKIENENNNNDLRIIQTSKNEILIKSKANPILSVEIFDISGRIVMNKSWKDPIEDIKINLSNSLENVYLIKILQNNNTMSMYKYVKL